MDKLTPINPEQLRDIVAQRGFNLHLIIKDYYLTVLLYLLQDIEGIYFKGGTALQKMFLNYSRISEDLDYTITRPLSVVRKEIEVKIVESGLFDGITIDKDVDKFVRLVVGYTGFNGVKGTIFIDVNGRGKLLLPSEKHLVAHFYSPAIPPFSVSTLHSKEMMAEKMAAAIGRNRPRDHFDIYKIIQSKHPLDLELVKQKCQDSGDEFDITKMFNKAQKLKNRWDLDLVPLLAEKITFQEVMTTLAKHFKLKEEKNKKKMIDEELKNSDGYKQLVKDLSLLIEKLPKYSKKKKLK